MTTPSEFLGKYGIFLIMGIIFLLLLCGFFIKLYDRTKRHKYYQSLEDRPPRYDTINASYNTIHASV
jgi:hypothetical protein